jgi:hypothetical protein
MSTVFRGVDVVGEKIERGSLCKIFRCNPYGDSHEADIGAVILVDTLEDIGYDGDLSVGVYMGGWCSHNELLVVGHARNKDDLREYVSKAYGWNVRKAIEAWEAWADDE